MAQVTVRFKRVHAAATIPRYAHPDDAGADLHACEPVTIEPGARALVGTGLALELPQGIEAQVRPRSGLALKHGVTVLNAPGTIDAGYRGELRVILINHGAAAFEVVPGMRIAQLVFAPLLRAAIAESDELSASARGEGGFGSTGA